MRIIFTCGGTAGHINPALALANTFQARKPDTQILFVGAVGSSMEATLVPQAGYSLKQVHVSTFHRSLAPKDIRHNLQAAYNLVRSRREARAILEEFRPHLVVGTGGFASYPAVRAAARMGIPTAIHESNAVPGLTTKQLAPHVDTVMLGLADGRAYYPPSAHVVVTGTPARPDFFAKTRQEARAALGLRDGKPLVLSYWGSLGAAVMNRQMAGFLAQCVRAGCPFHHIHGAGTWYYQALLSDLAAQGVDLARHPELSVREYIHDMPLVMAAADVVLCRAGASTISELTALSKPAILVPSPTVTGDHQTKNAQVLARGGGSVLLPEGECTPQRLWAEVTGLLGDPARRRAMGQALSALSPPDPTEQIYQELLKLALG